MRFDREGRKGGKYGRGKGGREGGQEAGGDIWRKLEVV